MPLNIRYEHLEIGCPACGNIIAINDDVCDKDTRKVTCGKCGRDFALLHVLQIVSTDYIRTNAHELAALVVGEQEFKRQVEDLREDLEIDSEDGSDETGSD